jgi:hypothetical protein
MHAADQQFGDIRVSLEPLLVEDDFPQAEADRIRQALARFGSDFPQLYLSVYLGPVMDGGATRPFAFWLVNHGEVEAAVIDSHYTIVVVIDPHQGEAAMAAGYAAERLLGEAVAGAALAGSGPFFAEGRWADGVLTILGKLWESLVATATAEASQGRMA